MKTAKSTNPDDTFALFVQQPISPVLVARLYAVAERMERRCFAQAGRKAEFITLSVAAALRSLHRHGHCLKPRTPQETEEVCVHGSRLIRRIVRNNAFHARSKRVGETDTMGRHSELSADALAFEALLPPTYLYGPRPENAVAPDPCDDPLCGPTGATLVALLTEEFGLSPARAWAWVLLQTNEVAEEDALSFADIAAILGTLGLPVNPALLRQWKKRHFGAVDAQSDAIRARLAVRLAESDSDDGTNNALNAPCHEISKSLPCKLQV